MSDTQTLMGYLRQMYRIRYFEEKVLQLRLSGVIVGSVHLYNGQEAIAVGALAARSPQDAVFATYRGHGYALACGTPLEAVFAELMGRETGINGGRGGSAYFSAPEYGFYGENSIVGGGAPISVGAALASKFDGSGRVAICAFGDGAMNQGSVHEAMNMASAFDLPVVFICENNFYSELTPIHKMVKDPELYKRAVAYGIPGERIDGNDPEAVRAAVAKALEHARSGAGPSLIEAMTARLVGHYIGDPESYRKPGELEQIKANEPIVRLRQKLSTLGVTQAELDEVSDHVRHEVEVAAEQAQSAPRADATKVREHLYG